MVNIDFARVANPLFSSFAFPALFEDHLIATMQIAKPLQIL